MKAGDYKIEKNIPIYKASKKRELKYPLDKFKVGDSILVLHVGVDTERNRIRKLGALTSYALRFTKDYNLDWKFKSKRFENGVRIWRIK